MLIDGWVHEVISGAKNFEERKLGKLLKELKKVDVLLCPSLSRIGGNLLQLNICRQKETQVWTIKDNYRLGTGIRSKVWLGFSACRTKLSAILFSSAPKRLWPALKPKAKRLAGLKEQKSSIKKSGAGMNLPNAGTKSSQGANCPTVRGFARNVYCFLNGVWLYDSWGKLGKHIVLSSPVWYKIFIIINAQI